MDNHKKLLAELKKLEQRVRRAEQRQKNIEMLWRYIQKGMQEAATVKRKRTK